MGEGTMAVSASARDGLTTFPADENRLRKTCGAVGAGIGSLVGRLTVLPTAGALAGAAAGSFLGPVGTVTGGILGGLGGLVVELHGKFRGIFPAGRVVGGTIGGALGIVVGSVLDHSPVKPRPSEALACETQGFSFKGLLRHIADAAYTSHPKLSQEKAREIGQLVRPGDVLVTNNEELLDFEIPLFLMAAQGNWTHTALYEGDGKVIESLGSKGVIERSLDELITTNHHAMILRPAYSSPDGPEKAIETAKGFLGRPYDGKFSLKSDDKVYCIEHTYKAVKGGGPELRLSPTKLFGYPVVTPKTFIVSPDLQVIYSTGSSFFLNYLSKFD
ncbi:MAG: hypothetical protein HYU64_02870 [Armatimonadetes bacterium]|nr:hypothetical protein [Armatimonadota bacterium]